MLTFSILAALGAMFCWGFGDFFIQKATRKIGDVETLAWIGLGGSVGLTPFVWNDLSLVFKGSNFTTLFLLGIVVFVVGIINFEALRRGKLSVVEVLLELELPITVILGVLFFQESLTLVQLLLIAVIFFGIIFISAKPDDFKKRHFFERGAVLAIAAAIGYGLVNFLTAAGAKGISPLLAIWFPWVVFSVICILYLVSKKRIGPFLAHARIYPSLILTIGILDTLAWVFFALAVQKNELSVTIAITESYPAISLLLGINLNNEKISKYQVVGAIMTIGASFLIGLTG
ncbi:MAG: DMT family transporter [Patescibacteria group bacterium]|mgnify:CR=1 FL=1